ncbi:hypothetical protein FRC03_011879 [Tulasnella sp. 419]|nr:hypothetical protein FRC03_011879 [Tulasnella sp. 419]
MKLSDIPPFQGNGSQDADKWQQDFLSSTSHCGDEAVARLFISKLAIDSPAHTLINSLPDSVKTSWFKLERVFRKEWLANRKIDPPEQDPWEAFERHFLTEEMIFGDSNNGDSTSTPSGVIMVWVDEHLRLGRNTGGTDECLVRMTKILLPIFVRTVLSSKPKSESFLDICATIRQIPHDVLEMEEARYRETLQKEERLSATARRLEEIAQRIEGLLKAATILSKNSSSDYPVTKEEPQRKFTEEKKSNKTIVPSSSVWTLTPSGNESNQKGEIPKTWELRNPDVQISKSQQLDVAQKAIDVMLEDIQGTYVFRGLSEKVYSDVWSALALHDRMMDSAVNKSRVEAALSKYCSLAVSKRLNPDYSALLWGISLIHGFQTYGNSEFLERAKAEWRIFKRRLIQKDQTTTQNSMGSCYDKVQLHKNTAGDTSLSGGVFKFLTAVGAYETTLYMLLSAYLSDQTREALYIETAVSTANCIKAYMIDSDSFVVNNCTVDACNGKVGSSGRPSVFLTGVFLEGLSILASASGDNAWRQLSLEIADASMKMRGWHQNGWILSPNTDNFGILGEDKTTNSKGILIRGLRHVWRQDPQDLVNRTSIRRYINTQYNALLDFSRIGDSYSNRWTEFQPQLQPSPIGQLTALDLVSAAIEVNQP